MFASDAKSRWAADWINWPGFDTLWTNVFRDLLPRGTGSEATASFDSANRDLVVDYRLSNPASAPATPPDIFVIGKSIGGGIPSGAYGLTHEVAAMVRNHPEADLIDVGGVGGTLAGNSLSDRKSTRLNSSH